MRRHFRTAAVAASASILAISATGSAQAAETHIIHNAANGQNTSVVLQGFRASSCSAQFLNDNINGLDARIVDVTARRGKVATLSFTTPHATIDSVAAFTPSQVFFDAACTQQSVQLTATGPRSGRLTVPANAKWMVVTGFNAVEFTFTISP